MRICVIGLGSMGKRRIKLLKLLRSDVIITGIDNNTKRVESVAEEYGIECYSNLSDIVEKLDCAFVCTPPNLHASIINECLENNLHVFSEINSKICAYSYHIGQYLPDWHPWECLKDFFVSSKKTNGCREILAIELPWIQNTFGKIKTIHVLKKKFTELKLNFPDTYFIYMEHENGNIGSLIVDVVSRQAVRAMEIFNEDMYIRWDGTPESLYGRAWIHWKKTFKKLD